MNESPILPLYFNILVLNLTSSLGNTLIHVRSTTLLLSFRYLILVFSYLIYTSFIVVTVHVFWFVREVLRCFFI